MLEVFNQDGILMHKEYDILSSSLENLTSGTYMLRVHKDEYVATDKVILINN